MKSYIKHKKEIKIIRDKFWHFFKNLAKEDMLKLEIYRIYKFWPSAAHEEIKRRKLTICDFLLTLSQRELEAIMNCEVDIAELVEKVFEEPYNIY